MKTKVITNTYLRDVEKYQIKLFLDEEDYWVSVKKLVDVREKFIINDGLCVMDNGYYIFEIIVITWHNTIRKFISSIDFS